MKFNVRKIQLEQTIQECLNIIFLLILLVKISPQNLGLLELNYPILGSQNVHHELQNLEFPIYN